MIRIIIAESDSTKRRALALLLQQKMASHIIEVQDVETLIRALVETPPDLLLLDWNLYGSPAPELHRLLQKAYPNLKVVLLNVDANDQFTATGAGADFVSKDTPLEDLIAALHN